MTIYVSVCVFFRVCLLVCMRARACMYVFVSMPFRYCLNLF